ncbi:hypothetical protein L218DRAFT_838510, partial [Marasmius fiardii PR-910]
YFWSFDVEGQTKIPKRQCRYLGLPTPRSHFWLRDSYATSWSTDTYKNIQKWQTDRGFDPTTTAFAEYLGYPVLDVFPQAKS